MSNFTVAIPDKLLLNAKIYAAKTGSSVNALIRKLLEGYIKTESAPLPGNFEILFRYSLGQIPARVAVQKLHLEDEDSLKVLTTQAKLPLPRLSLLETEAMRQKFSEMIDRFGPAA